MCYLFAAFVFLAGIFFTLGGATADLTQFPMLKGLSNLQVAIMAASPFLVVVTMMLLLGWRVQMLFGQRRREEKLAAKSAVGCLRLGSLGCGLWAASSALVTIVSGKMLSTGKAASVQDLFVGMSGFVLMVLLDVGRRLVYRGQLRCA